jgi:hypothetical protein
MCTIEIFSGCLNNEYLAQVLPKQVLGGILGKLVFSYCFVKTGLGSTLFGLLFGRFG